MPIQVRFTPQLQRHLSIPAQEVSGRTVREALEAVFQAYPAARGFILDDQSALRHHVVVFVAGQQVKDRVGLSDPIAEGTELYVMQALSGG